MATNCNHEMARCVDSTDPKPAGQFREEYECACGATGFITGDEQAPPSEWDRFGEVFR